MSDDLHAEIAVLKDRIRHLENVVRDDEFAEEKLRSMVGVAYQIAGVLASEAGIFDTPEIERVLDYLSHKKHAKEPLPFQWPDGYRNADDWQKRERELLEANTRFQLMGRHTEPLAEALEDFCTETRAYSSPECEDCEIIGPCLRQADKALTAYRKEFPK